MAAQACNRGSDSEAGEREHDDDRGTDAEPGDEDERRDDTDPGHAEEVGETEEPQGVGPRAEGAERPDHANAGCEVEALGCEQPAEAASDHGFSRPMTRPFGSLQSRCIPRLSNGSVSHA